MTLKLILGFFVFSLCAGFLSAANSEYMLLRENVEKSRPGDFIVTFQNKTYTLLRISDRSPSSVTMEEISIPAGKVPQNNFSWREWVRQWAPGHTSWVRYKVALPKGNIVESYSLSKQGWYSISLSDAFLPTLLNIRFTRVPASARKRIGTSTGPIWNPPMIVDGKQVPGVVFDVWRTLWPKDGSVLANKTIDAYLPQESDRYPSHFPYWLQVQGGLIGNTQIRIIDSGADLTSPAPPITKST